MNHNLIVRRARANEQWSIRWIVWRAGINPIDLNWRRFLVAERDGKVVGVGQVKSHWDNSRELASISVIPSQQARGIGSCIVRALMEREQSTLYLTCRAPLESYYARLGFKRIGNAQAPPYFRRILKWLHIAAQIPIIGERAQILVMQYCPEGHSRP